VGAPDAVIVAIDRHFDTTVEELCTLSRIGALLALAALLGSRRAERRSPNEDHSKQPAPPGRSSNARSL
jgi:hypothetical protein